MRIRHTCVRTFWSIIFPRAAGTNWSQPNLVMQDYCELFLCLSWRFTGHMPLWSYLTFCQRRHSIICARYRSGLHATGMALRPGEGTDTRLWHLCRCTESNAWFRGLFNEIHACKSWKNGERSDSMVSLMDRTPPQSEDRWRLSNQKTIRLSLIRQFPLVFQTAGESRSSAPFAVIPLTILSRSTITRSNEHIISPYKLVSHALLFLYHTWSCMQTNSWPLKGHPQLMG